MNYERLLNVAKAVREHPKPDLFDMSTYAKECGTPGCAWGTYAARTDLQETFELDPDFGLILVEGESVPYNSNEVLSHFDITYSQAVELFSISGCGGAKTPWAVAAYIEDFVARHRAAEQGGQS